MHKKSEHFSESINISTKKVTKICDILFIEKFTKFGEKSFTKKKVKILVNQQKFL